MNQTPRRMTIPAARSGLLVLGPVGPEGEGIAYRAWSPGEGDEAGLWIDATRIDDDPKRAERLARQAIALERVRDPNLAEVLRLDDLGGRLAIVERPGGPPAPLPTSDLPGLPILRRAVASLLGTDEGAREDDPGGEEREGPGEQDRGEGARGGSSPRGNGHDRSGGSIGGEGRGSTRGRSPFGSSTEGGADPSAHGPGSSGARDEVRGLLSDQPRDSSAARPGPSGVRRGIGIGLQVARGIRALHRVGVAHGNLGMDSVMVLDDGRVILFGLGRVAPPEVDPERPESPSFPEPDRVRRDLDGLGRLLYELVTGTPAGPSADPSVTPPPESLNPKVPKAVSELIVRLRIPGADGGIADAEEAVSALERIAGAPEPGKFLPREELAGAYASFASAFAEAPTGRVRRLATLGFFGGTGLLALLALPVGLTSLALGLVHLMAMAAGFGFVIGGARRGGSVFDRLRRFVFGGRGRDLATVAAAAVLGIVGLWAAGLLGVMLALATVAAILAVAREVLLDDQIDRERREPIEQASRLLRDLRSHGVAEPDVRRFAVDHGGEHWALLFRSLFGADAYRDALARRPATSTVDRVFRVGLAGRVCAMLDARLRTRRNERDRRILTDLEERRLKAEGVYELTARRRSWRIVPAVIARADAFEEGSTGPNLAAELDRAARDPEAVLSEVEPGSEPLVARMGRLVLGLLDAVTGPRARLLVGLALLAGGLAWAHQNRLIRPSEPAELVESIRSSGDDLAEIGGTLDARRRSLQAEAGRAEPLRTTIAPEVSSLLFRHAGALVAALILVGSAFTSRRILGLGLIGCALLALVGPDLGLPMEASLGLALVFALLLPIALRHVP